MKIYAISIFIVIAAFLFSLSSAQYVDNQRILTRCYSIRDCLDMETCYYNQCVDACERCNETMVDNTCGNNAYCYLTGAHTASCACYSGHVYDPAVGCVYNPNTVRSCTNENDCATHEVCHEEKCVDICQYHNGSIVEYKCGKNAHCIKTDDHKAICKCYSYYHGDPYSYCAKDAGSGSPCKDDTECSIDTSCNKHECIDICNIHDGQVVDRKCGQRAHCNFLHAHVAGCKCFPNHIGDPYVKCNEIVAEVKTCENNDDCPYYAACFENNCVDICKLRDGKIVDNKCGINAYCYDTEPHVANCKCHAGHSGDPFTRCNKDS